MVEIDFRPIFNKNEKTEKPVKQYEFLRFGCPAFNNLVIFFKDDILDDAEYEMDDIQDDKMSLLDDIWDDVSQKCDNHLKHRFIVLKIAIML